MFGKTLFIAATYAAATLAAECPISEFLKLTPIVSNPNVGSCTKESGFVLIPPSGLPNVEQKTKMCKSDTCKALITAVKGLDPSNCDLALLGVTLNVYQLVSAFDDECKVLLTPATTEPSATPATTEPSVTPATTEPSATPATTEPSVTPATTEPSATPATTEPSATPATTEPSVTPATTEPSATPATTEPSATPATTEPSATPATSEPSTAPATTPKTHC